MDASKYKDREHSQLFLVRLWAEQGNSAGDGERSQDGESSQIEWCGKLQDVVSGQAQYFRGWPTLIDQLLDMVRSGAPDGADRASPGGTTQLPP